MSHVAKIELEINSLEDLREACRQLGFTFCENQKTYAWYGRSVGDYPLPEGFTVEDLGKCDHAIKIPECLYEIGIIKRGTSYTLLWDSWHRGGLEKKIGRNAGILKQAYTVSRIRHEAKKKNYRVIEQRKDQSIRLVLRI